MKRRWSLSLILLAGCFGALSAAAEEFDGSKPLLCAMSSVNECTLEGKCTPATAESVSLPPFVKIDLATKAVTPAGKTAGNRRSEIKFMDRRGGQLILQGADAGPEEQKRSLGWTATISEETGKMVIAITSEDTAFVVIGDCLTL